MDEDDLTPIGLSPDQANTFRNYLAQRESGGRYNLAPNPEGYMGKYQMGPEEINDAANRVGMTQPFTQQDFLGNPQLQEKLFNAYTLAHHEELMGNSTYAGASPEDRAAILAGAHLGGVNGVQHFLSSGRDPADRLGTHVSDYVYDMAHQMYAGAGKQYAQNNTGTFSDASPGAAPDPEAQQRRNDAYSQLDKAMGPVGGGAFDHQPLPPTQRSPQPAPLSDAYSALDNAMSQAPHGDTLNEAPSPTTGYDWGSVGSAFAELPRGIARGFVADKLGLPADLANWSAQHFATHPRDAALIGSMELGEEPGLGSLAESNQIYQKLGGDNLAVYDPNAQAVRIPLGSQDITKAIKYVTGLDLSQQDTGIGGETLGHMGEFIGAGGSPAQLGRDAGQVAWGASKTKSLAGLLFHHVLAPAGISGGLDAGEWAVDKATGNQEIGEAAGIGARALLGGAAIASLSRGSRAAKDFVAQAPGNAVNAAFEAAHGSNAPFEKAAAAANLEQWTPQGAGLPEGYGTVPPALRTGSAPLQQMYFDLAKNDARTHNDFVVPGGGADKNISAMAGMRPEGDAQDAVTAVRNAQSARQSMIDSRIMQAKDAADQAGQIAARSSSGAPLVAGGPQGQSSAFDLANAYVEQLRGARDDAFAHADDQWQTARDQGFTSAPAPTKPMYSALEGLIGDNVRLQQGANFPYDIVSDLYKDGNPKGMFSKLGVRDPQTIGQNQLFEDGPTTLEQLKGVDSRLGNAIRMEQDAISSPGNRGNPTLLRNLMQVRSTVWNAIDDGAVASGNQVALRSAMDATAQAYKTFGNGIIARVLNERGGATNAPALLRSYLGNSQNAIQAADMFKAAMAQRTGAADARVNDVIGQGAAPQQQFSQALADWMRQDYLNFRADSKTAATGSRQWLTNHAGFFDRMSGNPDFDKLHAELQGYAHVADDLVPQVQRAVKPQQAAIDNSVAQHFLGGDAGPRLDAVFQDPNPGAAMRGIIQDTLQDSTGKAYKGLQAMIFDRVMNEGLTNDPIRPNQTYYSGKLAQHFIQDNATAFNTLRAADPQFAGDLDRLISTLALEDRGRLSTGLQLPPAAVPGKSGWSAAGSLATKGVQYLAAHFIGRNLPAAGLQGEALASQFGKELAQNVPGRIAGAINKADPMNAVRNALREALVYDPEKLRGLLAPVTGPSGQKWARGVEPWLQSVGVMLPQGWLQPQQDQQER